MPPPNELGGGDLRVMALIYHIVYLAAEGVERDNRPPPMLWQKEKAVVKTGTALGGFLLAVFFRGHVEPQEFKYSLVGK
jgi:hypothetical protein